MKRLITLLFAFSFVYSASAVTYYSKGNLNANLVASWSATTDGIGASPTNFTTGDIFIIQASHLMTTSATLSISGTASKLQISNTATLTATFAITLAAATTFQIDNGGTYVHNHAATMSTILGGTESFGVTSTVKISSFSGTGALSTSLTASVASGGNNYFFGNLIIDWASWLLLQRGVKLIPRELFILLPIICHLRHWVLRRHLNSDLFQVVRLP